MGDVLQFLIDGTSGLAPGSVDGKALVVGVCSRGRLGKGYLVGKRSDLNGMLGSGPLVDRLADMLETGGQEPLFVAVPVQGQPGGYISPPVMTGGFTASVLPGGDAIWGVPAQNADVVVRVATAGTVSDGVNSENVAQIEVSTDGGKTYAAPQAAAVQNPITLNGTPTGATLVLAEDAQLEAAATCAFCLRCAVGPVTTVGEGGSPVLDVTPISGAGNFEDVLAGAELVLRIVKGGELNVGTCQLSTDGGDNYARTRTLPVDGRLELPDLGVALTLAPGKYVPGTTYSCRILPPTPSIVDVMAVLEEPLATYDVEFVHIVGPSDSVDWAAAQVMAEDLWDRHRPTYFKLETRLPFDHEDVHDFTAWLLTERQAFAGRFVAVCCQYGEVTGKSGHRRLRSFAGLQSGRVASIPVQRATGRVKDGPIAQATLPEGWAAVQPALEAAGYITAKKYAGLQGVYWGDSRTMAEDTSDYRYEEVLRTTFKAVRLLRIAALRSLYDEAGDPLRTDEHGGLAYLKAQLENALDSMVKAHPRELAGHVVDIPSGQDIANNGVAVVVTLIGMGIIREIKLYAQYVYAGSSFDPRLREYALTA